MNVERIEFTSLDGKEVPGFYIDAKRDDRTALVIHGYGSSKYEMLGFAYAVAEKGYDTYVIDLRGHGDNVHPLDIDVIKDVDGSLEELRDRYEQIVTIGHSLGGLLSLKSTSDLAVAISPPLMRKVINEAKFMLKVNSCKVREVSEDVLFDILEKYNPPERKDRAIIVYGRGESKGVQMAIKNWAEGRDVKVVTFEEHQAKLPEIEVDLEKLKNYIPQFISHIATVRVVTNLSL